MKKISICFFAAIVLILYASVALADTNNVVIQWTIPSDTSFSISYPTGLTEVKFSPTSDTFTNEPAQSQTDTVASFELTNNGNLALNFTAVFETDMPSGVTKYHINTSNDYAQGWYWTDANDTTNSQQIASNVAVGASVSYWSWSDGTNVAAGTYSRNLQITSSAA